VPARPHGFFLDFPRPQRIRAVELTRAALFWTRCAAAATAARAHAVEHRAPLPAGVGLALLDRFPLRERFFGVATDPSPNTWGDDRYLVDEMTKHVVHRELAELLAEPCVEDHLEQKVTESSRSGAATPTSIASRTSYASSIR